jgi:hypothetical protein
MGGPGAGAHQADPAAAIDEADIAACQFAPQRFGQPDIDRIHAV